MKFQLVYQLVIIAASQFCNILAVFETAPVDVIERIDEDDHARAALAQVVEHDFRNARVVSSCLTRGTIL